MKFPIESQIFSEFISNNDLFNKTKENLVQCLNNFYKTDQVRFDEMFEADLDQVINTYVFKNGGVSLGKSFCYDPPLDYTSVWIRIYDNENEYLAEYTAFYDLELNCIDDQLK